MATISNKFNPEMFFNKTAHYASQGRGEFKLVTEPKWLYGNVMSSVSVDGADKILLRKGFDLLKTGMVAKGINIPPQRLATFEGFSYGGPTREHPYLQIFSDFEVDFLLMGASVEEAQSLYFTFQYWQQVIAGPMDSKGMPVSDSTGFALEYYDNFVAEAEMTIYSPTISPLSTLDDIKDQPILKLHYSELYPYNIGGIQTTWDGMDSPVSFTVSFKYYYVKNVSNRPLNQG